MKLNALKTPFPIMLMATFLIWGCSPGSDQDAIVETPVRAAEATAGPAVAPIEANGLIGARDEMRLAFKTGGIVRRIVVQEGDVVRRGAPR